jgi:uncharacterized protein YbjT (DUF2867 family)
MRFDRGDQMQTILGAGGAIGAELLRELLQAGKQVRLVGRNPKLVQGAIETVSADISELRPQERHGFQQ